MNASNSAAQVSNSLEDRADTQSVANAAYNIPPEEPIIFSNLSVRESRDAQPASKSPELAVAHA